MISFKGHGEYIMKRFRIPVLCISCIALCFAMTSCDSSDAAATDSDAQNADSPTENDKKDEYDEYIKSALSNVEKSGNPTAVPTQGAASVPATSVTVDKDPVDTSSVSSMDVDTLSGDDFPFSPSTYTDTPTPTPTETLSPTPTVDPNAPTPTPYITPDEFEVGTCCIYMKGESDGAYGTEIVTAINKVRKDLGFPEMNKNTGLTNCADRRTRELAASYSHTRPNGLPFYSLAPEHFKAEMLIINEQKGDEAVDAIIRNDPISKNLIFSTKYKSIGASSFKCNGRHYTVVAFGL